MKGKHIYIKHQAFNNAYEEIKKNSKRTDDGFERPRKYHYSPEKLKDFTNYVAYFHWSNELFATSTELIKLLRGIYNRAEDAGSAWYNNKVHLNSILDEYKNLKSSLNDLYDDISEFQNCMLATDISEKQAQIEALSDQVKHLATLETKIIETSNRKLYEISSSRVTYTNLFIALVALFVSTLSVFYSGSQRIKLW